ncbi:hypothetical protein FRACA_10010 [Frankia canadensis]|uniref:Uncharacterized protein n=1 Tax=Frankia canadensis TaxID=1836972 RepID=A0A2I2KHV9_9ACTN|nr:hypothetical protein FRACA_10010 [Frankia canadensis]SOU52541.1 hypothetical protein FRACA_10010 [Frankia canadensis]
MYVAPLLPAPNTARLEARSARYRGNDPVRGRQRGHLTGAAGGLLALEERLPILRPVENQGIVTRVHDGLRDHLCWAEGRASEPTAGVI